MRLRNVMILGLIATALVAALIVRAPRDSPVLDGAYKYVAVNGALRVHDLDREYELVKEIPVPDLDTVRGIAASARTGLLYVAYEGDEERDFDGGLVCMDLATDAIRWNREIHPNIDSMALSPDGKTIYMPTGERIGEGQDLEQVRDKGEWMILDALTGDERKRVVFGTGPHNTVVSHDGKLVYLAPVMTNYLGVLDATTETVVGRIGPFGASVRPLALTANGRYALVNVDFLSGFEVAELATGKVIQRVEVEAFPWENPKSDGQTQSHGVALSPDEREAWVADAWNRHVHVFDVSRLPARPQQIASIDVQTPPGRFDADDVKGLPKWINFSRDGRYVHVSNGAIIYADTRRIVKWIDVSRHFVEIHFREGKPIAAFPRYGVGYASPAWWTAG